MKAEDPMVVIARDFTKQYMQQTTGSQFGSQAIRQVFSWPYAENLAEVLHKIRRKAMEEAAQISQNWHDTPAAQSLPPEVWPIEIAKEIRALMEKKG